MVGYLANRRKIETVTNDWHLLKKTEYNWKEGTIVTNHEQFID
jgi:hypothetical protein